jgi:hypothetical protein
MKPGLQDCVKPLYSFRARIKCQFQIRSNEGGPSFRRLLLSSYGFVQFFNNQIARRQGAEHLVKAAARGSKEVQTFDHRYRIVGAWIFASCSDARSYGALEVSLEGDHLGKQLNSNSFRAQTLASSSFSSICARNANGDQEDQNCTDGLNPSGGSGVGFDPCQNRFRELEAVEHQPMMPALAQVVDRAV